MRSSPLRRIDGAMGKIKWQTRTGEQFVNPLGGGSMATAGNLVFYGRLCFRYDGPDYRG